MFSPLEQFDVINLFSINLYFFPFLSILIPFVLLFSVFFWFSFLLKNNLKIIPRPVQRLFEKLIEFIFNLIQQQIGKEGYIFFPLIFVLFVFVLFTIYLV